MLILVAKTLVEEMRTVWSVSICSTKREICA